ncbi:hypothetical protein HDV00_001122 [Rhizophlyctis rosea]|nr:hypothetical protein HDV00_001122 [Rhizophlyctis rosea]
MAAIPSHKDFAKVPARTDSGFDRIRLTLHQRYRDKSRRKRSRSPRRSHPVTTTSNGEPTQVPVLPVAESLIHQVGVISDTLRTLETGILADVKQSDPQQQSKNSSQSLANMPNEENARREEYSAFSAAPHPMPAIPIHPVNASSIFGRLGDFENVKKSTTTLNVPTSEVANIPPDIVPSSSPTNTNHPSNLPEDGIRPPTPTSPTPPQPTASPLPNTAPPTVPVAAQPHHFYAPINQVNERDINAQKAGDYEKKKRRKGSSSSGSVIDQEKHRYHAQNGPINPLEAFRRRMRYLENENICLKAELDNRCAADAQTIKALQSRLRALEVENRTLRETAIPTRTTTNPENDTASFLRSKVTHLEKEVVRLKQLAESAHSAKEEEALIEVTTRCETLQNDVHDLQMRVSRQNMELKSLLEQNSILRKENKRLIEQEGMLKKKLLASEVEGLIKDRSRAASPQQEPRSFSPVEREGIERLCLILETEIRSIEQKSHEITVAQKRADRSTSHTVDWLSSGLFQAPHLLDNLVKNLKQLKENMHPSFPSAQDQNAHPHQFLTTCADIVHTVSTCAQTIQTVWKESSDLDKRIHKLKEESIKIRKEAEETIEDLTTQYGEDVRVLEKGNRALEGSLVTLRNEVDKIRSGHVEERKGFKEAIRGLERQVADIGGRNRELERHVRELGGEVGRLEEVERGLREQNREMERVYRIEHEDLADNSFVIEQSAGAAVMEAEVRIKELTREIDVVREDNLKLQAHVASLERQVGEWKGENEKLRDAAVKEDARRAITEGKEEEILDLKTLLAGLEHKIDSEKLKNRKAAELIKSLNDQLTTTKSELTLLKDASKHISDNESENYQHLRRSEGLLRERVLGKERRKGGSVRLEDDGGDGDLFAGLFEPEGGVERQDMEAVLALIEKNQDTAEQLTRLSAMLEEHVEQAQNLKHENETLSSSLTKCEKRLKTREQAWFQKFTSLQNDIESLRDEQSSVETLLTAYESQFHGIKALAGDIITEKGADHPYPFLPHFTHLHNLYTSTQHTLSLSHQQNANLTQKAEERQMQLHTLEIAHQGKREECEAARRECEERGRRCAEMERRVREVEGRAGELEKRVREVVGEKRVVEGKLRKFVNGYRTLVVGRGE